MVGHDASERPWSSEVSTSRSWQHQGSECPHKEGGAGCIYGCCNGIPPILCCVRHGGGKGGALHTRLLTICKRDGLMPRRAGRCGVLSPRDILLTCDGERPAASLHVRARCLRIAARSRTPTRASCDSWACASHIRADASCSAQHPPPSPASRHHLTSCIDCPSDPSAARHCDQVSSLPKSPCERSTGSTEMLAVEC